MEAYTGTWELVKEESTGVEEFIEAYGEGERERCRYRYKRVDSCVYMCCCCRGVSGCEVLSLCDLW